MPPEGGPCNAPRAIEIARYVTTSLRDVLLAGLFRRPGRDGV
jgi:hypothetical protein